MANIDWSKLTFSYTKTNTILRTTFRNGEWTPVESLTDDNITLSSYAGALHYAIECFEGLKAFRGKDGRVRLFRPEENAKRLQRSAKYLGIEAPSVEMFVELCKRAVMENIDFLPPYEATGASLYLRPTLIGSNPQLGVQSSKESTFLILCSPVGAYVGGALDAVDVVIARNYDRAAPNGSGAFKVGGNYACSLYSLNLAHELGYKAVLYLDPATKTMIDEFNSSNFFAIKGNSYITPKSDSILPSITRRSLVYVAEHYCGMKIEEREVYLDEIMSGKFTEGGLCGTAAVISPLGSINDHGKEFKFASGMEEMGPVMTKLRETLTGIQMGTVEAPEGWIMEIKL